MKVRFPLLALVAAGMPLLAQVQVPVGIDLFGDAIVKPLPKRGDAPFMELGSDEKRSAVDATAGGYPHLLSFHDGRQLSGQLKELTDGEVVWTRADVAGDLRFPRKALRRIVFKSGGPRSVPPAAPDPKGTPAIPATLKLPGGDWLHGDVRSESGEEFSLHVAHGLKLRIPRDKVEWLYFGKSPAPAFGFSGGPLDLEGWIMGNPSTQTQIENGVFKLLGNGWIGRRITPPDRFEIEIEVPATDATQPTRLWLQPFDPSPNSYSTGTIELSFASREIGRLIYVNRFERENVTVEAIEKGNTRYRVFYDGVGEQVVVSRNGTLVGKWKMRGEKADPNEALREIPRPKGVCFDRGHSNTGLAIARMRVQPWNGVIPEENPTAPDQDSLNEGKGAAKTGKLRAITESEITFNDAKTPRAPDTFIKLARQATPAIAGDALLIFENEGELAAANLQVRDGRATCRTNVVPELDVPLQMLQVIVFPKGPIDGPENEDLLVFRNGDSLPGKLLHTSNGNPIRWQARGGAELAIQPDHVAGMRLSVRDGAKAAAGAVVELTNGDFISGEIADVDGRELHLRHDSLGEVTIPRVRLRSIYPNPLGLVLDAASEPEVWLGVRAPVKGNLATVRPTAAGVPDQLFFDGNFVCTPSQGSTVRSQGVRYTFPKTPDRYQLRVESTNAMNSEPYLYITLAGNNGTPSLQATIGHGRLRIYAYNMTNRRGRGFQNDREISLLEQIQAHTTRREVRAFVDVKAGTADFLIDGVHLLKFGRQSAERAPGLGAQLSISSYAYNGSVVMLSNISVRPWNGDLPRPNEGPSTISLSNGDFTTGEIGSLEAGALTIGSDAEAIRVPLERITAVDFGSAPILEKAAARVRLFDGTVAHLKTFQWENDKLAADSHNFGPIRVPRASIRELVLSPTPVRFPKLAEPKKLATKGAAEPKEVAP